MESSLEYQSIMRKLVISCDTFGGFEMEVDVALFSTKQQLIEWVVNLLMVKLQDLKLERLANILETTRDNFHIHDYEMGEILTVSRVYYICSHCKDNESTSSS